MAKGAAGNQAEAAAADDTGDAAPGQKAEATAQKEPSVAQKAPAPSQKAAAAVQKALHIADTVRGSDIAQQAEPDNVNATEAKHIAAAGASQAISLELFGTSFSAFSILTLEDEKSVKPALKSTRKASSPYSRRAFGHKTHIGGQPAGVSQLMCSFQYTTVICSACTCMLA